MRMLREAILRLALCSAVSALVVGCSQDIPKHLRDLSPESKALLAEKGMDQSRPIHIRIFKQESELEVWKAKADGKYYHYKTYPICKWSGGLGPKLKTGDKQAPEGFYRVSARQMNPNSKFHLAFNLGYPNSFDRAHGRTGAHLMVHGDCKSAGCYAMTDAQAEEIYILARDALEGGQKAFQVHAYPFRMTDANMRKYRKHKWHRFWKTLKYGYDSFEDTREPSKINVCERRYLVNAYFEGGARGVSPRGTCPVHEFIEPDPVPMDPEYIAYRRNKSGKTRTAETKWKGYTAPMALGPTSSSGKWGWFGYSSGLGLKLSDD